MPNRRQFLWGGTALTLGAIFASRPAQSRAADINITRIEEDWEVQVTSPRPERNTPELVTSMGPFADDREAVVSLLINHSTAPNYSAGGLQLQVWRNEQLAGSLNYGESKQLATANEVIRFTLVMELEAAKLKFQVKNGSSSTFGTFGENWIEVPTVLTSLNAYHPQASIERSAVSVGGNNLSKYQINQVRYAAGPAEVVDRAVRSCL